MSLPKWLRDRLGTPTRGRGCRAVKCINCRVDVLAGPNEDIAAMPAIVDPTPLSPLGEALALIDDRDSYRLHRHGQGLALTVRAHWDITGSPASDEVIVLTDHKCHTAKLPAVEIKSIPSGTLTQALPCDNEPPF